MVGIPFEPKLKLQIAGDLRAVRNTSCRHVTVRKPQVLFDT